MRIIAGSRKGARIFAPKNETRPTGDRVREAAFNLIGPVDEMAVLDLFAGSGAVGIEALSRGAGHATFIDSAKSALTALRTNLRELGVDGNRVTVLQGDSVTLAARHRPTSPYRLIFVDPPYRSDLAERAVLALPDEHLAADAVVVIEHDKRNRPPDALRSLLRTDERRYGDTLVSFYRASGSPPA